MSGLRKWGRLVAFAVGDFVADFEFFHESKDLVVHVGVGAIGPDFSEVKVRELSEVRFDAIVVEDFVSG